METLHPDQGAPLAFREAKRPSPSVQVLPRSAPLPSVEAFPEGSRHDRLLGSALRTLERMGVGRGSVSVGGGALLAHRWGHRPPGRLALFVESEAMRRALGVDGAKQRALKALHEAKALESTLSETALDDTFPWEWVAWGTPDGIVGAFSDPSLTPAEASRGIDPRHEIQVDSIETVLMRKVRGRMRAIGQLTERDALDLLAAERRIPESLKQALSWIDGGILSREAELLAGFCQGRDPGQAVLWQETARLLRGEPPARPSAAPPKGWSEEPNPQGLPEWRGDREILPAEDFSHPLLNEKAPLRPEGFMFRMVKCSAGNPLNPEPEDVARWLRGEKEISGDAFTYLREWLSSLNGLDGAELRQSCGASVADIARTVRPMGRAIGIQLPAWLNQYARRAQGDWRESSEGYGFLTFFRI